MHKRVLRSHTSAPAEPIALAVADPTLAAAPATRRVTARTDGATSMPVNSTAVIVTDAELASQHAILQSLGVAATTSSPASAAATVPASAGNTSQYYVPVAGKSGVWVYFRRRKDKPAADHFCMLAGCGATATSKSSTQNLLRHLQRKHGLTKAAVDAAADNPEAALASGAAAAAAAPPRAPNGTAAAGHTPSGTAAPNGTAPHGNASGPGPQHGKPPTWHMLMPLPAPLQRKIAEACVRNVLVPNMRPYNWVCTPGFQTFVDVIYKRALVCFAIAFSAAVAILFDFGH